MPPAIAVAGITAAAGIGGSVIAGNAAKSAANKAAAAQSEANNLAIGEQRRQFDLTREDQQEQYALTRADLSPWLSAGTTALGQQGDLLGLNGSEVQASSIDALKSSPLYAALFGAGEEALLSNASATGGLRGGNTQRSLANFGRDTLASVIESQLAKLGGVSAQGQNAGATIGGFGQNMVNALTQAGSSSANNISSLLSGTGTTQANAALASGQASAGMANNIAGAIGGLAGNKDVQQWVGKLF